MIKDKVQFIWLTCSELLSMKEAKVWTHIRHKSEVGADAEALKDCCLLSFQAYFLIESNTINPRVVQPLWGMLCPSIPCLKCLTIFHRPILWRNFLSLCFLFSNSSSVCQVDTKHFRTIAQSSLNGLNTFLKENYAWYWKCSKQLFATDVIDIWWEFITASLQSAITLSLFYIFSL